MVGGRNVVVLLRLLSNLAGPPRHLPTSYMYFLLPTGPTGTPVLFHFAPTNASFIQANKSTMRVLCKLILAGLALAAAPAKACDSTLDIVLETSGKMGFDKNGNDFDVLRELVLLTGRCHYRHTFFCLHTIQ